MLHQIGAGTLGPVFRAFDPEHDRLVAVKLLRLDLAPDRVHRLLAELERVAAAPLAHPGLAAPLAVGIEGNCAYIAQEYVSADSLDLVMRQYGPAPPRDAVRVATQLAGALDFAAAVRLVHGALHPRDVLVSPDETRVVGLGVARALENVGIGAPVRRPYTAPERIAGADWDRQADVFSLAAIIFEMLTGRRLAGPGDEALTAGTPMLHRAGLAEVFARALADDPAARFDTALAFAAALTEAIAQPVDAGADETAPGVVQTAAHPDAPVGTLEAAAGGGPLLPLDEPEPAALARPAAEPFENAERFEDAEPFEDIETGAPAPPAYAAIDDEPALPIEARSELDARPPQDSVPAEATDVLRRTEPPPEPATEAVPRRSVVRPMPPVSPMDRVRSAVWPLVGALLVGGAIGFAGGYSVGGHDPGAVGAPPVGAPAAPSAATVPPADAARPAAPAAGVQRREAAGPEPSVAPPAASAPPRAPGAAVAAAPTEAGPPGRVLIRSTPAGARVWIDGRKRGLTPIAVRDLAQGDHLVRLERAGYTSEERRFEITGLAPAQSVTVMLARPAARRPPEPAAVSSTGRFVGALAVDSRPAGARVFLDGRLIGTTPTLQTEVDAGEHAVRLELRGYRRWSSSVRVVSGQRNRVTASLEK